MSKYQDNKVVLNSQMKKIIEIICADYHRNISSALSDKPEYIPITDVEEMSETIKHELISKYKLALIVK